MWTGPAASAHPCSTTSTSALMTGSLRSGQEPSFSLPLICYSSASPDLLHCPCSKWNIRQRPTRGGHVYQSLLYVPFLLLKSVKIRCSISYCIEETQKNNSFCLWKDSCCFMDWISSFWSSIFFFFSCNCFFFPFLNLGPAGSPLNRACGAVFGK